MSSNQNIANATSVTPLCAMTEFAAPAPVNDAAGGGVPDTTGLLARPDVVRYLRTTLRRHGVPGDDLTDAIAEVQARSIEAARARRMPADLAQWKAFAATIAARWAVDRLREIEVRDKCDAGLCDNADAYAHPTRHREHRDPVDTKRFLAVLKEQFDSGQMPADAAEILWGEAEQVPHAQIAAEVGVSETAVRSRLFRMRAKFRARLAALGMLTIALLLLAALLAPSNKEAAPAPVKTAEPTSTVRRPPGWDGGTRSSQDSSFPVQRNGALPD